MQFHCLRFYDLQRQTEAKPSHNTPQSFCWALNHLLGSKEEVNGSRDPKSSTYSLLWLIASGLLSGSEFVVTSFDIRLNQAYSHELTK